LEGVLLEEAFKGLARLIKNHSFSIKHAFLEHAFVAKKLVGVFSPSMGFTIGKLAFVLWGVIKLVNSLTMRHAIFPLSLIKSLHSIKNSIAVGLAVNPIALENICIKVEISAFAMSQSSLELPLISLGVGGNPNTLSVIHIILPLT
jgi:hypothetical protein